jgi:preprotein translocase subunit SecB
MVLKFHNTKDIKDKALIEITYATLITIEDVKDKKILQKIILIEVPTEVYPKVFEIFSFLLSHSGLPKMSIKKDIDFNKLYDEQVVGKKLP